MLRILIADDHEVQGAEYEPCWKAIQVGRFVEKRRQCRETVELASSLRPTSFCSTSARQLLTGLRLQGTSWLPLQTPCQPGHDARYRSRCARSAP